MTVIETTIQAARTWIKLAAGLTDGQVIPVDDQGGRPPVPYLTVAAFADAPVAQAEQFDDLDDDGDPRRTTSRSERVTISIQSYGPTAGEWVRTADLGLYRADVQAALLAAGVTVIPGGAGRPLTLDLGAGREVRQAFDFEARYTLTETNAESLTAAEVVALETDLRHRSGDADTLTTTTSISL